MVDNPIDKHIYTRSLRSQIKTFKLERLLVALRILRRPREVSKNSQAWQRRSSLALHVARNLNEPSAKLIILGMDEPTPGAVGASANGLPGFAGFGLVFWMAHYRSDFRLAMSELALEPISAGSSLLK